MLGYLLGFIRALSLCLLCAGQLAAQTPATTTPPKLQAAVTHRPGVGLLAAAGLHTGLALGARFGLGDLGIEVTGGYQLLLAFWSDPLDGEFEAAAGSSAQFGGEVYFTPWHPLGRFPDLPRQQRTAAASPRRPEQRRSELQLQLSVLRVRLRAHLVPVVSLPSRPAQTG